MSLIPFLLPALAVERTQVLTPAPMMREFRAVWVATVDNIDWPSKRTLTTNEQKLELIRIMDVAKSMNLNAIIFQVRPSADALYASKYEPWSEYLTNQQGRRPNPYYDPLEFAVQEAHKRGMELHCWFNPYRALHPAQKNPLDRQHIGKTNPDVVKKYGPYLWMDPSEPLVQRRSLDVMLDVVRNYDVDGVHIDDYFYPYKVNGPDGKPLDFPDEPSWRRYRAGGGTLSRDDWRRKSVDDFIRNLYDGIKREKRWVKFGISPFGIFRPGYPEGIKAGVDQYADLYADARKWFVEGWCDYYTPQLYWPVRQTAQSYPRLLDWWAQQNAKRRHLWPGNFTGRTNPAEGDWKPAEVLEQIDITRRRGAMGNAHFSMRAFMKNYNGITDALRNGPYREPALVPASPWLDAKAPNAPRVTLNRGTDGKITVRWQPNGDDDIRFYSVSTQAGQVWQRPEVGTATEVVITPITGSPTRIAVTAIDRAGNASRATVMRVDE
jgi:uncharacterized lipoprotein YddW (UPF0748 family)